MTRKNSIKKVAAFAALAAVLGYVAGILTAPRSGNKTRQIIKTKGKQEFENVEDELKMLYSELSELITAASDEGKALDNRQLKRFKSALAAAKKAKVKLAKVLEAIKDEGSDDKDLDKAVKEAEKAIKHAKVFLLKN